MIVSQSSNTETLCEAIVDTARKVCPTLVSDATVISKRFLEAFSKFSACHNIYNGNYLEDHQIDQLGIIYLLPDNIVINVVYFQILEKNIEAFMGFYRSTFPQASVLPKMHLMESHMVPWLRKWHLGFGMMGEQGAESIHASFNSIERSFANMIHNRVDRLLSVVKEHHLRISPANITLLPPVKRRKKEE